MSGEMRTEREYTLMQYLPYMLVPFYPVFQERGAQKVERPKADWEVCFWQTLFLLSLSDHVCFTQNYTQTKVNEEIYKTLAKGLRTACTRHGGSFRHFASDEILRLEFAPMINRIISPPLRPVWASLLSTSLWKFQSRLSRRSIVK